jgi:histidine triad (HIT) family protein
MAECVFCTIAAGTAEASIVFEDEDVIAFLDIRPVRPGQTLVIPKRHIDHFDDVPDVLAGRVFAAARRIARAVRANLSPVRVGMVVHGFGVPHAHIVIVPLHHPWDITSAANARLEEGRVVFRWEQVPLAPRTELDAIAAGLQNALIGAPCT